VLPSLLLLNDLPTENSNQKVFIGVYRKMPAHSGGIIIVIGLTMIKVKPGHENSFYRDLQSRAGIKNVYHLFGEYSFFLIMQVEGQAGLNQLLQDITEEDRVIRTGPFLLANNEIMDPSLSGLN
jgi:Lrp/AsnC ligand binding domain